MVMQGRPAFCPVWPPEKLKAWKAKFIEPIDISAEWRRMRSIPP